MTIELQPRKSASPGPLVTHGLESLAAAVDLLREAEPSPPAARHAIVLLAMGAELLLKSRLVAEHWSLVFEKIEVAKLSSFEDGSLKSVGPEQCVKRLADVCQVELSARAREALAGLWDYRNRVVHFAIPIPVASLRTRSFAVLSALSDFVHSECTLSEADAEVHRAVTKGLEALDEYVAARNQVIASEVSKLLDGGYFCPACGQRAVDANDGMRCLFCRETDQYPGEVWDAHVQSELGVPNLANLPNGNRNVAVCHACTTPYMVVSHLGKDHMRCLYCMAEASRNELIQCADCRRWRTPSPDPAAAECPECPGRHLTLV